MYKLTVKLEQYTPLIHFQHDQPGATLRATELKPKLDKFLMAHAFAGNYEAYKPYLVGYSKGRTEQSFEDKKALDYKVRIIAKNGVRIEMVNNPLYFGNMDKKDIKASFANGDVEIEFFSFKSGLIDIIQKHIAGFFSVTNFGTRQSKGFGSFYIKNDPDLLQHISDLVGKEKYIYREYAQDISYKVIMDDLAIIYPLMKSGINIPNYKKNADRGWSADKRGDNASYHKSFLFQYMLNKGIGNEKRFIKERFFRPDLRIADDNTKKRYVRAMLGVAWGIEFKDKRKGKIEYASDIDRFKSPITFKIACNKLVFIPEQIPDVLFNKKFTFKDSFQKKDIYTPAKEEFNLVDFLYAFADYFNALKPSTINNRFEKQLNRALQNKIIKVGDENA